MCWNVRIYKNILWSFCKGIGHFFFTTKFFSFYQIHHFGPFLLQTYIFKHLLKAGIDAPFSSESLTNSFHSVPLRSSYHTDLSPDLTAWSGNTARIRWRRCVVPCAKCAGNPARRCRRGCLPCILPRHGALTIISTTALIGTALAIGGRRTRNQTRHQIPTHLSSP